MSTNNDRRRTYTNLNGDIIDITPRYAVKIVNYQSQHLLSIYDLDAEATVINSYNLGGEGDSDGTVNHSVTRDYETNDLYLFMDSGYGSDHYFTLNKYTASRKLMNRQYQINGIEVDLNHQMGVTYSGIPIYLQTYWYDSYNRYYQIKVGDIIARPNSTQAYPEVYSAVKIEVNGDTVWFGSRRDYGVLMDDTTVYSTDFYGFNENPYYYKLI